MQRGRGRGTKQVTTFDTIHVVLRLLTAGNRVIISLHQEVSQTYKYRALKSTTKHFADNLQ